MISCDKAAYGRNNKHCKLDTEITGQKKNSEKTEIQKIERMYCYRRNRKNKKGWWGV